MSFSNKGSNSFPGYFGGTARTRGSVLLFTLTFVSLPLLAGCSQDPVIVEKSSPQIKTEFFDKRNQPEGSLAAHNECANTHWHYKFSPDLAYDLISRSRTADGEEVAVKIRKVNIKLGLEVTMWLPQNPTNDCSAHEKGHAEICIDAYKNAENVAKQAATPLIGKELIGRGSDYKTTLMRLLTEAQQQMTRKYREETVLRASLTSGLYDEMTVKEHAAATVEQKVSDAELEYQRLLPEFQRKQFETESAMREQAKKLGKELPPPDMNSSATTTK